MPDLTDREFNLLSRLIYECSGINLGQQKHSLLRARLAKRLRVLGLQSFKQYYFFITQCDPDGRELTHMLDAISTNLTQFFREPQHFDLLRREVLPPLVERRGPITAWSAACSTGEEPYSIAMTIADVVGDDALARATVLASDLSTKALRIARDGVYKAERVAALTHESRSRYFEQGTGAHRGLVRAAPGLRRMVEFRQENLLHLAPSDRLFDFIFCRNVMIYFDQPAQQRVIDALDRRLAPGGFLFISHAESLSGVSHGLTWVASAVYRKVAR
jgi:chemotaxis protein methyltransferase CheR